MSKLNELKEMNPLLRGAMGRRDGVRKHVRKHKSNVLHHTHRIETLEARLVETQARIQREIGELEAKIELESDYVTRAGLVLLEVQSTVDEMIKGMDIKPKPKGLSPQARQVIKDHTEALAMAGRLERDALPKSKPVVPVVTPAKSQEEEMPPAQATVPMSKRARRAAKRKAALAKAQG